MAGLQKAKKTKKQRKYGRNALYCERYRREHRREKSHLRRIAAHLKKFPSDHYAATMLVQYKTLAG